MKKTLLALSILLTSLNVLGMKYLDPDNPVVDPDEHEIVETGTFGWDAGVILRLYRVLGPGVGVIAITNSGNYIHAVLFRNPRLDTLEALSIEQIMEKPGGRKLIESLNNLIAKKVIVRKEERLPQRLRLPQPPPKRRKAPAPPRRRKAFAPARREKVSKVQKWRLP